MNLFEDREKRTVKHFCQKCGTNYCKDHIDTFCAFCGSKIVIIVFPKSLNPYMD